MTGSKNTWIWSGRCKT